MAVVQHQDIYVYKLHRAMGTELKTPRFEFYNFYMSFTLFISRPQVAIEQVFISHSNERLFKHTNTATSDHFLTYIHTFIRLSYS